MPPQARQTAQKAGLIAFSRGFHRMRQRSKRKLTGWQGGDWEFPASRQLCAASEAGRTDCESAPTSGAAETTAPNSFSAALTFPIQCPTLVSLPLL